MFCFSHGLGPSAPFQADTTHKLDYPAWDPQARPPLAYSAPDLPENLPFQAASHYQENYPPREPGRTQLQPG